MTFLQIRQRIAELLGLSSTDVTTDPNGTTQDKLKAWVNNRYKVLAGKRSWNWLLTDYIIQTVPDITTGTVTATIDSTTITFTDAPTDSVAHYDIQFSDTSDWYRISTHTAASTTAVLEEPYLGTTSATLTYTLRKQYYAYPANAGKIVDMRQTRTKIALRYVPIRQLDRMIADRTRTGKPEWYTISGLDSNQQYRIELYPTPNVRMNIETHYYKIITDMTSDSETPLIPEAYHEFLVWDVLGTYGYTFLDDTRISAAKAEAADLLKEMVRNDIGTEDIPVRLSFDVDLTQVHLILRQLNTPIVP